MSDTPDSAEKHPEEVELFREHPSMFRNSPVKFSMIALLLIGGVVGGVMFPPWPFIACAVALMIFVVWWLQCKATTLIVTNEGTTIERGLLSKSTNELWHSDVRNVQVNQTFFQRVMKVGSVSISSGAQADIEIVADGIPDPYQVHRIIEEQRRKLGQV